MPRILKLMLLSMGMNLILGVAPGDAQSISAGELDHGEACISTVFNFKKNIQKRHEDILRAILLWNYVHVPEFALALEEIALVKADTSIDAVLNESGNNEVLPFIADNGRVGYELRLALHKNIQQFFISFDRKAHPHALNMSLAHEVGHLSDMIVNSSSPSNHFYRAIDRFGKNLNKESSPSLTFELLENISTGEFSLDRDAKIQGFWSRLQRSYDKKWVNNMRLVLKRADLNLSDLMALHDLDLAYTERHENEVLPLRMEKAFSSILRLPLYRSHYNATVGLQWLSTRSTDMEQVILKCSKDIPTLCDNPSRLVEFDKKHAQPLGFATDSEWPGVKSIHKDAQGKSVFLKLPELWEADWDYENGRRNITLEEEASVQSLIKDFLADEFRNEKDTAKRKELIKSLRREVDFLRSKLNDP